MTMNIIVTILLLGGLFFFAGGAVGIIRFPDFYTRLHPAGKLDTAGLATTMGALALYTASSLSMASLITALKIILIFVKRWYVGSKNCYFLSMCHCTQSVLEGYGLWVSIFRLCFITFLG